MTNPLNAHDTGNGRYYVHPETGETWPSVTNIIGTGVNKPALVPWAAKITADAALRLAPQLAASMLKTPCRAKRKADRCGVCTPCVLARIKGEHSVVKDTAADLGSRIHAIAEATVLGKPHEDDPEAAPFVEQAIRFYDEFHIDLEHDVEAAETTVVNRAAGYAGTLDLLLWLDIGQGKKLTVLDYKTSSTRPVGSVYPEYGLQVAALIHGETALLDTGDEVPLPRAEQAVICNLRAHDYALTRMPVAGSIDDAYRAFIGCLATTSYLHAAHDADRPQPLTPPEAQKKAA